MNRLRGPLLSLDASGRLARAYTLARRLTGPVWLLRGRPDNPNTPAQREWRHMYQKATALWHALSAAETSEWEILGTARHMTGFAYFVSQALRPNPGLYLPLQGGTMAADINMDGHQLTDMVDPTDPAHAARKAYVDAEISAVALGQGARIRSLANRAIQSGINTRVTFDVADHDTDGMWRPLTSVYNLYLTTAGIYVIHGQAQFEAGGPQYRHLEIHHSTPTVLARTIFPWEADTGHARVTLSTIFTCAAETYLTLLIRQNTGVPMNVIAAAVSSAVLSAQRIG